MTSSSASYGASPTKRSRRTKQQAGIVRAAIYEALQDSHPQTVRQLFYRLVSAGVIDKTEQEYKGTVCRLTAEMRRAGELPYEWLADNTRWMRKPKSYASLANMLDNQQQFYRRDLWAEQEAYVEIWLEKDALSGVLLDVTAEWDVPLMVTRGYPSLSYLHSAGEQIASIDKPTYLYYFGDHDPSGVDIPNKVYEGVRDFAPDAEIHFERVAVNPDQIQAFKLLTRPTKSSDSRSKSFEGESVEVDALPVNVLKNICHAKIVQHIDHDRLDRLRIVEDLERQTLTSIASSYRQGGAA